ncbi:beta-ketoacyl synthase N-terminal-like domain-containing protein [Streptomyces sp. NPDC050997]|uniref:beta-ketoacyl synthase N-terminal-like domain-containing protein n=1 Tax=Streptomyces sp. NPDC050997 TaxID=3155519 RepID=UPI00341886DB
MRQPPHATAIVGMAVLLPGAADLDAYWRNLLDGKDAITDVPEGRWDADYYRPQSAAGPATAAQVYCRRGGFVDALAEVEVTRFGIMPTSVAGTEPDQLIALEVAARALADAGGEDRLPDRHRVGVVLGRGGYLTPGLVRLDQRVRTAGQLVRTLGELLPDLTPGQLDRVRTAFTDRLGPESPESAIGLVPNLAASRIANRLDLRGPAYTVDAACASSLVAVDHAVSELAAGRCDLMLAGGVHHCHDITLWSVFSQLRALSPSQRIRPFHRGADGILIGEGTGVVVLKRLADAERDGDRVYAVIRGTGVASDGRAASLVNPDSAGQTHAVRQAWRAAGLDPTAPGSIGLLEAHGTATPAGDAAELATLAEVFGPAGSAPDGPAVIGSVKSMIGHTMPAAGVAGLVKAALAVHHGMLLPTLHCDDPHPALTATRFRPLGKATAWETSAGQPVRRAAVNAFGFGGINAHVVLEEAPDSRRGAAASASAPTSRLEAAISASVPDTRTRTAGSASAPDSGPGPAASTSAPDTRLRPAGSAPAPDTGPGPAISASAPDTRLRPAGSAPAPDTGPGPAASTSAPEARPGPRTGPRPRPTSPASAHPRASVPVTEPELMPGSMSVTEPERMPGSATVTEPERMPASATVTEPERVFALAADGPEALATLLDADDSAVLASGLDTNHPHPSAGRSRLGIVAPTAKRLALARRAVAKGRVWQGRGDVWFTPRPLTGAGSGSGPPTDPGSGKLAFVFPGLEGDFAPRVDDVATHFGLTPVASAAGGHVGDVGRHGFDVVAVGRLLDAAMRRMGVVPDAVAGHSVGEWTAMAAAGVYAGDEVSAFMEAFDPDTLTVPGLAFAAIGAPAARVLAALDDGWSASGVVLSHDNAPNQSMVCGPDQAVDGLVRSFRAEGVLSQVLPFRSGFHTPMLKPYLAPIEEAARTFRLRPPTVPLWSGTTASPFPADERAVRDLFVRHLLEPVRFRQLVESLYAAGHRVFVQVGTGQLGSLIGDTLSGRDHLVVPANSPHRTGLAQLLRVATALWTAGRSTAPALPPPARPPGTPPSPRSPRPPRGSLPPVRLDLGGALVSLENRALTELRAELRAGSAAGRTPHPAPSPAPATAPATAGNPSPSVTTSLEALAARSPMAAELSALLRDTADTAAALITAGGHRTVPAPAPADPPLPAPADLPLPASPPRPLPTAPQRPARTGLLPTVPQAPARPADRPRPTPASATPRTPRREHRTTLHVSPDTMPYLLDHCFFPQRPGWPDVADRWPVVPATTIVRHMMDAAEQTAPGMRAVAVHHARFDQWLTATPPSDTVVTVTPDDTGRLTVTVGSGARGSVELAPHYPAAPPLRPHTGPERAPDHTAAQLYAERWMFHGPAFQGVTALTALGDHHVRGTITTPPAPGALLDNVGQLLGYWIMATRTERTVVFPVQMRRLRFFGPHPLPGTEVECLVRISSLTDTVLEADVQLAVDGTVWAELTGWQDRRFDNDPKTRPVERFPERNTLSETRPGGWSLLHERWPDLASRELIMRNSLSGAERSQYAEHTPRGRRQWLLGRIAAKDAVRQWLWDHGEGPVFPAEIRVHNEESGRPYVTGLHGRTLPPLDLSLAHRAEAAVAIVRPHTPGPGPGIDIEEVVARDTATLATALGADELRLLRARIARSGESEALWFTRFWAAKEAVAKAEGSGFGGRPRDFRVLEATEDLLLVSGRLERAYAVHCAPAANPAALPDRTYVVAWTAGPTHEEESHDR